MFRIGKISSYSFLCKEGDCKTILVYLSQETDTYIIQGHLAGFLPTSCAISLHVNLAL